MSEVEYLKSVINDANENLEKSKSPYPSLVGSRNSRLIQAILDQVNFQIYAVDCDLMVRQWSLSTGACLRSYALETRAS